MFYWNIRGRVLWLKALQECSTYSGIQISIKRELLNLSAVAGEGPGAGMGTFMVSWRCWWNWERSLDRPAAGRGCSVPVFSLSPCSVCACCYPAHSPAVLPWAHPDTSQGVMDGRAAEQSSSSRPVSANHPPHLSCLSQHLTHCSIPDHKGALMGSTLRAKQCWGRKQHFWHGFHTLGDWHHPKPPLF